MPKNIAEFLLFNILLECYNVNLNKKNESDNLDNYIDDIYKNPILPKYISNLNQLNEYTYNLNKKYTKDIKNKKNTITDYFTDNERSNFIEIEKKLEDSIIDFKKYINKNLINKKKD